MTTAESAPIACSLAPGDFKARLAWIGALTRDALRSHERRDLVLDLRYAPEARERVREMVRSERACCSFLTFDLREKPDEILLVITAPEAAREAADILFEQFVAGGPPPSCACGAPPASPRDNPTAWHESRRTHRHDTGDWSRGVRRVLRTSPCLARSVVLASAGSILAWFAGAHAWVTGTAIIAVAGAWGWVAWQAARTRCMPAASTVYLMAGATCLTAIAVLWPLIEPELVRLLMP